MILKNLLINEKRFKENKAISKKAYILNFILVTSLITLFFFIMFNNMSYKFYWESVYEYKQKFIDGFIMTILISFFSLILSLIIGSILTYAQNSKIIALRFFAKFYIEIIRGTPLIVQILIFFYVFANNLGFDNRYIVGIFILSMFCGAYVSEIIRSGIESIDKEQFESSLSLGFNNTQIYIYIIIPQAMKVILPPITGQFASLIKDSSLLSIISISELTMNAQEVNAFTYSTLEAYLPLALGYLILTYPISLLSYNLEKKYKTQND